MLSLSKIKNCPYCLYCLYPPRKQTLFFNCLQTVFLKTIETIETILGAKNVLI